jgi:hypothetical protein
VLVDAKSKKHIPIFLLSPVKTPAPVQIRAWLPDPLRLTSGNKLMDTSSKVERQHRARRRAMSLAEFCERYSIGRTKAYEELHAGRLRARKCGTRTIITEDEAEDWLQRLPKASRSKTAA